MSSQQQKQNVDRWSWTEASDEEFERNRPNLTYYRIYKRCGDDIENLYKFWAKNDDEAFSVLKDYIREHEDSTEENTFYSTSGYFVGVDGKRHDAPIRMHREKRGVVNRILDFLEYGISKKIRNVVSFARCGHAVGEYWSLDSHMLEDLSYNIPLLIENTHGCPTFMCEKAREKLCVESTSLNYSETEVELAMSLWKDELRALLEHVLLYKYYNGFGIVEKTDRQMMDIDAKYRSSLPFKPGTDEEFDYAELEKMIRGHWNAIWDWIKEKGESLWD